MIGEAAYLRTDAPTYLDTPELELGAGAIAKQPTILPQTTVVYPQTVLDAKNELDPVFAETRADVQACGALTELQKSDFEALYAAWRRFFCRNATGACKGPDYSWFGLGSQLDEVESYQQRLFDWQQTLTAAKCTLSAPGIAPPNAPILGGSIAKWTAFAIGGVVVLYVLHETGVLRRIGRKSA